MDVVLMMRSFFFEYLQPPQKRAMIHIKESRSFLINQVNVTIDLAGEIR